jgi:hypothetical protein
MYSYSVCIASISGGPWGTGADVEVVCGLSPGGHPCPPYIGRWTRLVDRSLGRLQQGNISLVYLHHGKLI